MRGYPCGELAIATVDQLWGVDRRASLNPSTGARAWYGYVTTQRVPGTARQLLNDAGHVTASANYDPYGSPEGAALPPPFGYTGELTDPATGSQYLRARWYRPGQGSLLGVDPLLAQTGQAYSYAGDNPANGADPTGDYAALANPPTSIPQSVIDSMIKAVKDAWPNKVTQGGWNPNGTPVRAYIGTEVHKAVADYYRAANPGDNPIFTNYNPVRTILRDGYHIAAPPLTNNELADKPDIVNVPRNWLYEIKPTTAAVAAVSDLAYYLGLLHRGGATDLRPGPSSGSGTAGIVPAPGGYAVFGSPAPGVILYQKFNGDFQPKKGLSPVPLIVAAAVAARAAAGAVAAALEAIAEAAAALLGLLGALLNPGPPSPIPHMYSPCFSNSGYATMI